MPMPMPLPDVAAEELPAVPAPLDWVGMRGIDLPLLLEIDDAPRPAAAKAEAQVNLPDAAIKGIHMSRLYRLLDTHLADVPLTPGRVDMLLAQMVASHADCRSTRARLSLAFALLLRRPALVTPDLHGWKAYPVVLEACRDEHGTAITLTVRVAYSSTCPCSAALSRQLVRTAFDAAFGGQDAVPTATALDWLSAHAMLATPHSQRSEAEVQVPLSPQAATLDIERLIDVIESALGTAVQTAVKRADEQAFAALNGQNLMYVEDAARKIRQALDPRYTCSRVQVTHAESLHPHDATATSSSVPRHAAAVITPA